MRFIQEVLESISLWASNLACERDHEVQKTHKKQQQTHRWCTIIQADHTWKSIYAWQNFAFTKENSYVGSARQKACILEEAWRSELGAKQGINQPDIMNTAQTGTVSKKQVAAPEHCSRKHSQIWRVCMCFPNVSSFPSVRYLKMKAEKKKGGGG